MPRHSPGSPPNSHELLCLPSSYFPPDRQVHCGQIREKADTTSHFISSRHLSPGFWVLQSHTAGTYSWVPYRAQVEKHFPNQIPPRQLQQLHIDLVGLGVFFKQQEAELCSKRRICPHPPQPEAHSPSRRISARRRPKEQLGKGAGSDEEEQSKHTPR